MVSKLAVRAGSPVRRGRPWRSQPHGVDRGHGRGHLDGVGELVHRDRESHTSLVILTSTDRLTEQPLGRSGAHGLGPRRPAHLAVDIPTGGAPPHARSGTITLRTLANYWRFPTTRIRGPRPDLDHTCQFDAALEYLETSACRSRQIATRPGWPSPVAGQLRQHHRGGCSGPERPRTLGRHPRGDGDQHRRPLSAPRRRRLSASTCGRRRCGVPVVLILVGLRARVEGGELAHSWSGWPTRADGGSPRPPWPRRRGRGSDDDPPARNRRRCLAPARLRAVLARRAADCWWRPACAALWLRARWRRTAHVFGPGRLLADVAWRRAAPGPGAAHSRLPCSSVGHVRGAAHAVVATSWAPRLRHRRAGGRHPGRCGPRHGRDRGSHRPPGGHSH